MDQAILDALIESLSDPNAGWEYDRHYARNSRIKCDIWLANGPGFVDVGFYGQKIFGDSRRVKNYKAGGTLLFHPVWARRIYNVARKPQLAALSRVNTGLDGKIVAAIRSASEAA